MRRSGFMSTVWNAVTYDTERRRLVPCFDEFYGTASELIVRSCPSAPAILDLGAGTGILSAAILRRIKTARLTLLDASAEMLERAGNRLAQCQPQLLVQPLTSPLPPGPFHAVVSALAIHHLTHQEKRDLYRRILRVLTPGGLFINAEQILGATPALQKLFEETHLDCARTLGSSQAEIESAVQRMGYDRCATVVDQLAWLNEAGYVNLDCFFRWFRFAVFAGWKSS